MQYYAVKDGSMEYNIKKDTTITVTMNDELFYAIRVAIGDRMAHLQANGYEHSYRILSDAYYMFNEIYRKLSGE